MYVIHGLVHLGSVLDVATERVPAHSTKNTSVKTPDGPEPPTTIVHVATVERPETTGPEGGMSHTVS